MRTLTMCNLQDRYQLAFVEHCELIETLCFFFLDTIYISCGVSLSKSTRSTDSVIPLSPQKPTPIYLPESNTQILMPFSPLALGKAIRSEPIRLSQNGFAVEVLFVPTV